MDHKKNYKLLTYFSWIIPNDVKCKVLKQNQISMIIKQYITNFKMKNVFSIMLGR